MSMPEQYPIQDLADDDRATDELMVVGLSDEPLPEPKPALSHVATVTAIGAHSGRPTASREGPAHRAE
jgi:hypothetical protein